MGGFLKFEFFKVPSRFGYLKSFMPVGKIYDDHAEVYRPRVVEVHRMISTPFGSLRIIQRPVTV